MAGKKALSDRPVTQENLLDMLNREVIPALKQTRSGAKVTGSRGGNAALASLLTALANAGVITDGTVP